MPVQGVCWRCRKAVICQAVGFRMCSKSHLRVDQLLEQELREQCLLLRLSQWFGSPCGCFRGALTPGRGDGNTMFFTLGFVECHLPGKLLTGVSQSWWGPHLCHKAAVLPVEWRGSFPSHLESGREQSPPGLSLVLAFPLQGESSGHSGRSCWSVPAPASPTHFVLRVPAVVSVKP